LVLPVSQARHLKPVIFNKKKLFTPTANAGKVIAGFSGFPGAPFKTGNF